MTWHMLYGNYISIKQEEKKKSMGERNFHLLLSDQGCYLYLSERMDGGTGDISTSSRNRP